MATPTNTTDPVTGGTMTVGLCAYCLDIVCDDFEPGRASAVIEARGLFDSSMYPVAPTVEAFGWVAGPVSTVTPLPEGFDACHFCGVISTGQIVTLQRLARFAISARCLDAISHLLDMAQYATRRAPFLEYARLVASFGLGFTPDHFEPTAPALEVESCRLGHLDCSTVEGGPCSNEAESVATASGLAPLDEMQGVGVVFFDEFGNVCAVDVVPDHDDLLADFYGETARKKSPAVYGVRHETIVTFSARPDYLEEARNAQHHATTPTAD